MPPKCNKDECIYEKERNMFIDSKFLKTAGVVIGLLTPLFTFIIISIFTLKEDVSLVKQRQDTFNSTVIEIRSDLKEIKSDISSIKINIARDNRISFNFDNNQEEKIK